ncbi:thioredoxin domain-containing protein [Nocardioides bruguierae]|uniref:Thioredoxin domain-containing protein n=1 Tax=Nocardioides bruguierae TaxID=2945102 RepID=A0A9X2IHN8_9ACTN|nr:thioredoxin domain-containing protein [Nocardioides bruguierae]MCM0622000.1 thioredoxin domain-containing protein [Nocardioides bruguierae]
MPNRLAAATSPYLLQHAENPVDWWEWGPDAFEEARHRDVPVLLSVGYAACHWCHVMAHESFEDDATAAYLNAHYVCVKVDREERPDVDTVYMNATTAMTGQGGWPMTCVLDHEGSPFFAGTYFPDVPQHGMPSFRQVLEGLSDAWENRRDEVGRVAANLREHLASDGSVPPAPLGAAEVATAVRALDGQHDDVRGGFGGAPKFPPSMVLELLRRVSVQGTGESPRARQMLTATVEAMARGGMYDQLAGGFARYSVDDRWVVPHFEKMLYDNAQLLGLYARLGTSLGDRVAAETADWMLAELRTPEGGFASALDADTEGEEGRYYVWTPAQLAEVLGPDDADWAAQVFGVTERGTFEHGSSVLQRRADPEGPGEQRLADVRTVLRAARETRTRPARDDKVVAAWNGLVISSLVDAGSLLRRPDLLDAALDAGRLLAEVHLVETEAGSRLLRVSRDGVAGRHTAVLEDLGCVAGGFLALAGATADPVWLHRALALLEDALTRFRAEDGGFLDTPADASDLLTRPRDPGDNASPSGLSATVHALLAAHALTGTQRYLDAAHEALGTVAALAVRSPRFAGWSLAAAAVAAPGVPEVAVVGAPGERRDALEREARRLPGAVVAVADPASPVWSAALDGGLALLEGRAPVPGATEAAYLCRGFVCQRPTADPAVLREVFSSL